MAKEVDKVLKLQIRGGAANPSPPVGPALGAAGVMNIPSLPKPLEHKINPISLEIRKLMDDKSYLDEVIIKGKNKATSVADSVLSKVNEAVGFLKR